MSMSLKEVPASIVNQQAHLRHVRAFSRWWGTTQSIRCPGCHKAKGLVYLEIRNDFHAEDTYRVPTIIAVCREMADRLHELKKIGVVFGISALVRQVGWICAKEAGTVPAVPPPSRSTCGACRYCVEHGIKPQVPGIGPRTPLERLERMPGVHDRPGKCADRPKARSG